jgi:hypothetical protein
MFNVRHYWAPSLPNISVSSAPSVGRGAEGGRVGGWDEGGLGVRELV